MWSKATSVYLDCAPYQMTWLVNRRIPDWRRENEIKISNIFTFLIWELLTLPIHNKRKQNHKHIICPIYIYIDSFSWQLSNSLFQADGLSWKVFHLFTAYINWHFRCFATFDTSMWLVLPCLTTYIMWIYVSFCNCKYPFKISYQ